MFDRRRRGRLPPEALIGLIQHVSSIHRQLNPFHRGDLPPKLRSNWKLAGPGAVLVGLSIGAGEIVVWPRIVAEFGAPMVWAAVVGVLLQMWINMEIGRWTIATGETIYTGYCRVWRGFAALFILFNVLGWLAPGWGRASGLALKALIVGPTSEFGSDTFWTAVTFLGVVAVLFGPKVVYKSVERTVAILVVTVTLGLIYVVVRLSNLETWQQLGEGIINVGYVDPRMNVKALFIAVVFAGAGGTANLFYSFYLRDKHIGMGSRIPEMANPLRGHREKLPATGFQFPDTTDNQRKFKSWFNYVRQDQFVFFFVLNLVTMLLFIFGALAVLHPKGAVPQQGTLIWDEAIVMEEVLGSTGRTIFLMVGVATLFSTQLALLDGVSRSIADIIYTNFNFARTRDVGWWYLCVVVLWIGLGLGITFIMEKRGVTELGFLFNAAYMGGFAMAVYVPLTLLINLKYLPRSARPGLLSITTMTIASVVYCGFALLCVLWEFQTWLGA